MEEIKVVVSPIFFSAQVLTRKTRLKYFFLPFFSFVWETNKQTQAHKTQVHFFLLDTFIGT